MFLYAMIQGGHETARVNFRPTDNFDGALTDAEIATLGYRPIVSVGHEPVIGDFVVQTSTSAITSCTVSDASPDGVNVTDTYTQRDMTFDEGMVVIKRGIQALLNSVAAQKGYDNMFTLKSYHDDDDATFADEGQRGKAYRTAVWTAARTLEGQIIAQTHAMPTSVAEFISWLPAFGGWA